MSSGLLFVLSETPHQRFFYFATRQICRCSITPSPKLLCLQQHVLVDGLSGLERLSRATERRRGVLNVMPADTYVSISVSFYRSRCAAAFLPVRFSCFALHPFPVRSVRPTPATSSIAARQTREGHTTYPDIICRGGEHNNTSSCRRHLPVSSSLDFSGLARRCRR